MTDGVYSAGYTYLANSALVGQITFRQGTNVRLTTTRAYDGNGNVTALIDAATGALLTQYEYGPFGEPIRVSGALAKTNPFRFSTKYQDDETDLLYYGYRYYGPSAGRWTSRDPIGEDAEANLYAFVANSPLSQVDLLGQILVGVDGTGSAKWLEFPGSGRHNSHVKNFCDDYGGRRAYYLHGPDTLGVSTAYLARRVYDIVCAAKSWDSFEPVHLIGFSRGGAAVIRAAQLLKEEKCGCDQEIRVDFMGLYDAVDRAPIVDTREVPDNVQYVAHARRNPLAGSRDGINDGQKQNGGDADSINFGNTGTSGGRYYVELFFWGTHAGVGGNPWGGDRPLAVTRLQDRRASAAVDFYMRIQARVNNVPISTDVPVPIE